MKEPSPDSTPEPICYRIPTIHWLGDAIVLPIIALIVSVIAFLISAGIVLGALRSSPLHLTWITPLSLILGLVTAWVLGRGRVGRVWRLAEDGIERGSGLLRSAVPYEQIRLIAYERADRYTVCLRLRLRRGSRRIFLAEADLRHCFDAIRLLCPHAGGIDENGTSLPPTSDQQDIGKRALALEWRRRGWTLALSAAAVVVFGPFLWLMRSLASPAAPAAVQIGIACTLSLAWVVGFGFMSWRAFRESRRVMTADLADSSPLTIVPPQQP